MLIDHSSWQGRIPFILVFEIGTSVDLFQEKLSRSTLRRLRGRSFETRNAMETLDVVFGAATDCHNPRSLFVGANLYKMFFDRQMEKIQDPQAFVESLKVSRCYLTIRIEYVTKFYSMLT